MMSPDGEVQLGAGDGGGRLAGAHDEFLGLLVLKVNDTVIGLNFFNTLHTFLFYLYATRSIKAIPVMFPFAYF